MMSGLRQRHNGQQGEESNLKIKRSAEDYLEAILILGQKQAFVRSIDVANQLGYSKPSVSIAMKNLRENGYIAMAEDGHITLLPPGREIAEMIYERHRVLADLLETLGVPEATAVNDACQMEHVLSPESFAAIKKLDFSMKEKKNRGEG